MRWFVSNNKMSSSIRDFPKIKVKERLKKIEIEGYSRMANPVEFYEELLSKLESYFISFNKTLIIDFKFEYINTASGKWLFEVLTSLQNLTQAEGLIEINWFYEEDDETILETGEIFKSALNLPFHLKEFD